MLTTCICAHQYVKYCSVIWRNTDCAGTEVCWLVLKYLHILYIYKRKSFSGTITVHSFQNHYSFHFLNMETKSLSLGSVQLSSYQDQTQIAFFHWRNKGSLGKKKTKTNPDELWYCRYKDLYTLTTSSKSSKQPLDTIMLPTASTPRCNLCKTWHSSMGTPSTANQPCTGCIMYSMNPTRSHYRRCIPCISSV